MKNIYNYFLDKSLCINLNKILIMEEQKVKNHGGARKNSGRKKSPYESKIVSFYVRKEWEAKLKEEVKKILENFKQSN